MFPDRLFKNTIARQYDLWYSQFSPFIAAAVVNCWINLRVLHAMLSQQRNIEIRSTECMQASSRLNDQEIFHRPTIPYLWGLVVQMQTSVSGNSPMNCLRVSE